MNKKYLLGLLSIILVACIAVATSILLPSNSLKALAAEKEAEVQDYIKILNEIEFTGSSASSAYPSPVTQPEAFLEAYKLGYEAVPFVLDYIIENNDNGLNGAFLIVVSMNNLHLSNIPGVIKPTDTNVDYSIDRNPVWFAKQIKELAKSAPKAVEKICNSDITFEEKVIKLQEYGMLAVPILQEKIEKGETQWEAAVLNLTLAGMSLEERYNVLQKICEDDFLYSEKREADIYNLKNTTVKDVKFDKSWFDENEDKLTIMNYIAK